MNKKQLLSSLLLASILLSGNPAAHAQISGSTVRLLLQNESLTAQVNGSEEILEVPAIIDEGSFYVPIKWVAQKLGLNAVWNADLQTVQLKAPRAYLEWNLKQGTASANGETFALQDTAIVRDGSLLVKLSWAAAYLNVSYTFKADPARIELTYVQPTGSAYPESPYSEDSQRNSRPYAQFATDKAVYRLGEPVHYIDMSYDPDAEGLPQYEWTGKEDAFFEPGTYTISLRVQDGKGSWSVPFTREVTIKDEPYMTESEFPWYTNAILSFIRNESADWKDRLLHAPDLSVLVPSTKEGTLVSDGQQDVIEQPGLLLRKQVEGKARLAADYRNGMSTDIQLATVISNPSPTDKLTVHVTRSGKLSPTLFQPQLGREAAVDFLTQSPAVTDIVVEPGKTKTLEQVVLEPGQGAVGITDMETSGAAEIGYIAAKASEEIQPLDTYAAAGSDGAQLQNGKAAEASSDIHIFANGESFNKLLTWTVGGEDSIEDHMAAGDGFGTIHRLSLDRPQKMAIALAAKDGYVNGALKINGKMVTLPQGGITDQDGAYLVYRTDGSEPALELEWMAAPDSKSPVQWIFYPLEDKN